MAKQVERRRIELQVAIVRSGMPGYRVAQAARLHPSRLSQLIHGRVNPTADERRRLAGALKVSEDDLFAEELATA